MFFKRSISLFSILVFTLVFILLLTAMLAFSGCRNYDSGFDLSYFFKTEPEKAVIDFLFALNNEDAGYIYNNLILDKDKRSVSKEKFIREINDILSRVEEIEISSVAYLGYESGMGKVIADFKVIYINGDFSNYKKYIYLKEENGKWRIVFDKTFI